MESHHIGYTITILIRHNGYLRSSRWDQERATGRLSAREASSRDITVLPPRKRSSVLKEEIAILRSISIQRADSDEAEARRLNTIGEPPTRLIRDVVDGVLRKISTCRSLRQCTPQNRESPNFVVDRAISPHLRCDRDGVRGKRQSEGRSAS